MQALLLVENTKNSTNTKNKTKHQSQAPTSALKVEIQESHLLSAYKLFQAAFNLRKDIFRYTQASLLVVGERSSTAGEGGGSSTSRMKV